MAGGEGEGEGLEQKLTDLTRRFGELEGKVRELEARAAAAEARAAAAEAPRPHTVPQQTPAAPMAAPPPAVPQAPPNPWPGVQPGGRPPQPQEWMGAAWSQQPQQPHQPLQPQQPHQPQPGQQPLQPQQPHQPQPGQQPLQPQQPHQPQPGQQPQQPPYRQYPGYPPRPAWPPSPGRGPQGRQPGRSGPQRPAGPSPQWPPVPGPQRPPAQGPRPSIGAQLGVSVGSLRDLESRLTGRLLAWVGAAAVVLGAVFFLSLAFSRGWIGPEGRVALGLAGGTVFVGLGAWMFGRRQAQLGHVLIAVGIGVVSLALFAGTRLYGILPPEVALVGSFVAAVTVAAIAVRVNSEAVAIYGLVAVVAAPPVLGAPANLTTVAFLGVTLVGTTAIALARSWRWLPPLAFTITAPQVVAWLIAGPDAATAIAALGAYWLLHAVAAAADELRAPQEEAEARAEALWLANSMVAVGGGLYVLWNGLAAWQGAFVAAAALAHLAFGAYFVWRRGDKYPFGMLVNGIGIGLVALAIERQFDGPPVAIGWAVEATVLAAIYGFRRHVPAGCAALVLAGLAVAHLALFEYPALEWSFRGTTGPGPFPFADQAGLTLTGLVMAGLLAGWLSRSRRIFEAVSMASLVVVAFTLPFELSGSALVAGWAAEAVALVAIGGPRRNAYATAAIALLAALPILHLGWYEYPTLDWSLRGSTGPGPFPFADQPGLTLACLLVAGAAAAWLSRSSQVRDAISVAGPILIAFTLPYELSGAALVAGWAVEAVALVAAGVWRRQAYAEAAIAVLALLPLVHVLSYEYPAAQWALQGAAGPGPFPFADAAGIALGCLLGAAFAGGWLSRNHDARCGLTTAALIGIAYALPFELTGIALVAAWAGLVPVSVAAEGILDRLPGVPATRATLRTVPIVAMNEAHWPDAPLLATAAAGFMAIAHLLSYDLPVGSSSAIAVPAVPFTDLAAASAAIGIGAFLLAAFITARRDLRTGLILLAAALAGYSAVFELATPFVVVAWCALAVGLGAWSFRDSYGRWAYVAGAATMVGAAAVAILAVVVPVERLGVHASVASTGVWFALHAIAAVGATAAALTIGARFLPIDGRWRTAMVGAAATGVVYLLSALLVDFFQGRVGGGTPLEELQKQAQVSVSILWGVIGMAIFLFGIVGWRQIVREAGLALLALATGKVFLFDLSYLDVAYRVLSLMGIGLLLLGGAYAYQSLRPRRAGPDADSAEE